MSQVETLEETVKQLSPDELATFRSWFVEFDAPSRNTRPERRNASRGDAQVARQARPRAR